MTNFEVFMAEYENQLKLAVAQFPAEYVYPASEVPAVAARMGAAFKNRSYNKDSRAIKMTCKLLGVKHTYSAINSFLEAK